MESKKSKKQEKKSKNLEEMKQTLNSPEKSKKLLENMDKDLAGLKTTSGNIKKELDNNIKSINLNFTDSNEETDRKKQNIKVKTYLLGQYQKLNKQFKQTEIYKYRKILSSSTEKMKTSNTGDSITANTQNILQEFTNALYPKDNMHSFFFNSNEKNEKSDETLKKICEIYDYPLVKNLVDLNSYIYENNNKIKSLTDLYTNISKIVDNNSNEGVKGILKKIDDALIEKKNEGATSETKKKTKKTSKKISDVLQENTKKLKEKKKQITNNQEKMKEISNLEKMSWEMPKLEQESIIFKYLQCLLTNDNKEKNQLEKQFNLHALSEDSIPTPQDMELLVQTKLDNLLKLLKNDFRLFTPRVLDNLRKLTSTFLQNRPQWLVDIENSEQQKTEFKTSLDNLSNIISMIRKNKWNTFDFKDFIIKYSESEKSIASSLKEISNNRFKLYEIKKSNSIEKKVKDDFTKTIKLITESLKKLTASQINYEQIKNKIKTIFASDEYHANDLSIIPRYMINTYTAFYNLHQKTKELREKIIKLHNNENNFCDNTKEKEKNKQGSQRCYKFEQNNQNNSIILNPGTRNLANDLEVLLETYNSEIKNPKNAQ